MSKTKLLLTLVTDIRSVADDLEALYNCMAESETAAATVTAGSPAQSAEAHTIGWQEVCSIRYRQLQSAAA